MKKNRELIEKIKSCVGKVNIKSCVKMLNISYHRAYYYYNKNYKNYE